MRSKWVSFTCLVKLAGTPFPSSFARTPLMHAQAEAAPLSGRPAGALHHSYIMKPIALIASLPSSVNLSGPHGGFHTQLMSISSMPSSPTNAAREAA